MQSQLLDLSQKSLEGVGYDDTGWLSGLKWHIMSQAWKGQEPESLGAGVCCKN